MINGLTPSKNRLITEGLGPPNSCSASDVEEAAPDITPQSQKRERLLVFASAAFSKQIKNCSTKAREKRRKHKDANLLLYPLSVFHGNLQNRNTKGRNREVRKQGGVLIFSSETVCVRKSGVKSPPYCSPARQRPQGILHIDSASPQSFFEGDVRRDPTWIFE